MPRAGTVYDSFTTDPTVNSDSSANFRINDFWINSVSNQIFICVDNSVGAALWIDASVVFEDFRSSNEGRVKINGSGGVQPMYSLTANVDQVVDYGVAALDLSSSPTNEWPRNISSPSDSDVWDSTNTTLIENTILGQLHAWRVILDYSGKNVNDVSGLKVTLRNTLSGFETSDTLSFPEGLTSDTDQQAILFTIADGASLPAPFGTGQGYQLVLNCTDGLDITIQSVTRISEFHNTRG